MLPTLLVLAFTQAPAPSDLRPATSVSFHVAATRFQGFVDETSAAKYVADTLFPSTMLRAPHEGEPVQFELAVSLEEPGDSPLVDSYLSFALVELAGKLGRQRPQSYKLLFRNGSTDSGKAITLRGPNAVPPGLQDEVELRIRELAANPAQLVQMLLCHVPIVGPQSGPLESYFFLDDEDGEHELRLPFRYDQVRLGFGSVFLVQVSGDRERWHLVRGEPLRLFAPSAELPAYLTNGVVGMDCLAGLRADERQALIARGAPREASDSRPNPPPVAKFESALPLADLKPVAVHKNAAPAPRLLTTTAIYVAHCEPMSASDELVKPSQALAALDAGKARGQ